MIESFRSKALKELFETGASKGLSANLIKRLRVRLSALHEATALAELAQPGFNFHPLRGKPQRYSIHVNGPWCLTFEWQESHALRLDLEQYH
jgi:proteic killer suppression protein